MGCFFGSEQLDLFLEDNGLDCLIRAHEWFADGIDWPFGQQGRCLTVFSSSNYCGKGNKAAVALVSENCAIETVVFEPIGNDAMRRICLPQWIFTEGKADTGVHHMPVLTEAIIDTHSDTTLGLVHGS
jgi:protein phosphatase